MGDQVIGVPSIEVSIEERRLIGVKDSGEVSDAGSRTIGGVFCDVDSIGN